MIIKLNSKYFDSKKFSQLKLPKYEFHIAKEIRKKYNVSDEFFSIAGNLVFVNNQAVRKFVKLINDIRPASNKVKVGEVNAAGLLDEIYHFLFRIYEIQVNPGVIKKALDNLNSVFNKEQIRKLLFDFISVFPPIEVYNNNKSVDEYLNSKTAGRTNVEITLEEMVLFSFANINPANKNILELFHKSYLSEIILFEKVLSHLEKFFANEKKFGPDNQDLFTFFKMPIIHNPENFDAQLDFIREKWGILLDEKFLLRILSGKDLIREDYVIGGFGGGGGAPTVVPRYKDKMDDADFLSLGKSGYKYADEAWKNYDEPENFTQDIDWMPKVVVLAKNTYVWLDQLSKKYGRYIRTLDQVPDEELDQLAQWGFNGLWLIGIWERSNASRKIKHIMGNTDAVASAYSLYDYQIAWDIGGEDAFNNLNSRAKRRGIRLASDMVPNHTGIFSRWVTEHPDYFVQTNYPPFPNYSFSGPDLSDDQSYQIRIEDGYWNHSDAAVVFQRIDNRTGETRYIYHGNDGTNMPWNDTAQLNMLQQDVREAVIQKIFDVARKFSIIRFDAAMTLTKRHFSRLWFPPPGKGGDIPSRSDFAITQDEFDRLFPVEFWREVVDRINSEMPETLLLAEAFWLMEGYFVRSLGMHRVYNSAFMHMMMKEENEKYRDLISNTLEFEPEILKRYVNFMSNPDEETAIRQFGTDDKYFGICTLMVTLPGLPMFAHGQIEGYTEKYGMEYQRAYYNETPNQWLIDRHEREIFPLIKKRYLFSNVVNFWLFDFIDGYGNVNENVFAFTNFERGERTLVFYNNKYDFTSGKIYTSSQKLVDKNLQNISLVDALRLNKSPKHFYIYKEHVSNLEFIKSGEEISNNGFEVQLNGFKYLVYMDFREVYDTDNNWERLAGKLHGKGVANMAQSFAEMLLEPVHIAFERLFDEESMKGFVQTCIAEGMEKQRKEDKIKFIDEKYYNLLKAVNLQFNLKNDTSQILNHFENKILAVRKLNEILEDKFSGDDKIFNTELHKTILTNKSNNYKENAYLFFLELVISEMKRLFDKDGAINKNNYIEKALLSTPIRTILKKLGRGEYEIYREILLINILLKTEENLVEVFEGSISYDELIDVNNKFNAARKEKFLLMLENDDVKSFLGVNEFEGVVYYSKENFEEFLSWIFTLLLIEMISSILSYNAVGKPGKIDADDLIEKIIKTEFVNFGQLKNLSNESGYRFEILKESFSEI